MQPLSKPTHDFLDISGYSQHSIVPLKGDASSKRYSRLYLHEESSILLSMPPEDSTFKSFVEIAIALKEKGFSPPEILYSDLTTGYAVIEDFGDILMSQTIKADKSTEVAMYEVSINTLIAMQERMSDLQLPEYNKDVLMQEALLLSEWLLPFLYGDEDVTALQQEYAALWNEALNAMPPQCTYFVHRDYHADNLMWLPDREPPANMGLLDFQDALIGSPAYDLVSLLEDARRNVSYSLQQEMLNRYITHAGVDKLSFMREYYLLGLQRNCKILGIFVRLKARDNKSVYMPLVPRVWNYMEMNIDSGMLPDELTPVAEWLLKNVAEQIKSREW